MKKYQKIYTLGHRATRGILDGPVVVQEKVDGSNFGFGRTLDGRLFAMSRTMDLSFANPDGMFRPALEYVQRIERLIEPGAIFRCEFLSKPKHNVLCYDRAPKNGLVLFDIEPLAGAPCDLGEKSLLQAAYEMEIDCVPTYIRGPIDNVARIVDCLDRQSFLGGPIEGVVVKNYRRFGPDGDILAAKIVRSEFKETHSHILKQERASTPIGEIGKRFATPARWHKAVMRLAEAGKLVEGPEDIGGLLKEIRQDVEAECLDEIKEELWKKFRKEILSCSISGLPEWYKSRLGQLTCA